MPSNPFAKPRLLLELTGSEVMFLADSIKGAAIARNDPPEPDRYMAIAQELLLLLGGAYCELVHDDGLQPGPVALSVSAEMAWILRELVKTESTGADGKNLGIQLLRKLYALLLSFSDDISGEFPMASKDGDISWEESYGRSASESADADNGTC